jgi:hypothetical protein
MWEVGAAMGQAMLELMSGDESPVPGCMDPAAGNFNVNATEDDGSCSYIGCTDPAAANYFCTEYPEVFPCTETNGYTLADVGDANTCQVDVNPRVNSSHILFSSDALILKADVPHSLEVMNVRGEMVHTGSGSHVGEYRFSRMVPEPGIYFLKLTVPDGTVSKRFMVF